MPEHASAIDLAVSQTIIDALATKSNVLLLVCYCDDLTTNFVHLKDVDALKLVLINKNFLQYLPNIVSHLDVFDAHFFYDGPSEDTYGNKVLDRNTEIVVPSVYDAVSTLLDQMLPHVKDKDRVYLNTLSEEILVQLALLRRKYGLCLGPPVEFAELFVSKVRMKDFYRKNRFPYPEYAEIDTKYLRSLAADKLQAYCEKHLPEFPVFAKPTSGAGCFESFSFENLPEFVTWVGDSGKLQFNFFLIEEQLNTQVCYGAYSAQSVIETVSCSVTPADETFGRLVQKGVACTEKHLTEGPLYRDVEQLANAVLEAAGAAKYPGAYCIEMMRKASGELVIIEMMARCFSGMGQNDAIYLTRGYDPECYAIAAPFMQDTKLKDTTKYRHVTSLHLPSWTSGTVKKFNEIDMALVQPGVKITFVEKLCSPGDKTDSKRLESIYWVAMNINVAGDDENSVDETADAIKKFHDPVVVDAE